MMQSTQWPCFPARRSLVSSAVLFLSSIALAACATSGPAYGPPSKDVAATVHATTGLSFEPEVIRIHVGQTVEWRNTSLFTHTVTDDPEKTESETELHAQLPAGAVPFNATLPTGQVFRHTFSVPGTYEYFCIPHEAFEMRGKVIVEQ